MPGIGPKSSQRIAFQLLQRDRDGARDIANALLEAADGVGHCQRCHNFSEQPVCAICANHRRDQTTLCIVQNPIDVSTIEQSAEYRGLYFVLMGHLSPLDGIGPNDIGLDRLQTQLQAGAVKEVILATGTTPEGEATAHYIAQISHNLGVHVSRIAFGVPIGGDLEYVDSSTLSHAITSRREV